MKNKHIEFLILAYVFCAAVTFGVSFNLDYEQPTPYTESMNTSRALISAAVWPLYVSYALTKGLRK